MSDEEPTLEGYVHHVYSVLLNLKGENQQVHERIKLRAKSGALQEIDVYYEFVRAGVTHRVAIECRDRGRPVEADQMRAFIHKLSALDNVSGVFVSRRGYQPAARTEAEHYGVLMLTAAELPGLGALLAMQIKACFLPGEETIGEPFWTVMPVNASGEVTGSYAALKDRERGRELIPLFFSKRHAAMNLRYVGSAGSMVVRGINQVQLRCLLGMIKGIDVDFLCYPVGPKEDDYNGPWSGMRMGQAEVRRDYLLGDL